MDQKLVDQIIENELITVSIIMPTYRRAGLFLVKSINSVLNQSYGNVEVVVVDDNKSNSVDKECTSLLMQEYGNEPRVRFIAKKDNSGGSKTRNFGILAAKGKYITFLDDDDLYKQNKVKRQLRHMLENDLDMCFTDLRIHTTKDEVIDYRQYHMIKSYDKETLLRYHLTRKITGTPTFMYKKSVLLDVDLFDDAKVGQEFILMLKTIEKEARIGYLPKADVIAYVHPGEKMSKGKGKIAGEKHLYEMKKQYFNRLSFKERQFVKFRYHLVLTVVGVQDRRPLFTLKELFLCVVASPSAFVGEIFNYVVKVRKVKKVG